MDSLEQDIAAHATREAPRECCGLVLTNATGGVVAMPTENLAADPLRQFLIPMEPYAQAIGDGTLVGYYHSHVLDSAEPSDADRHVATEANLPMWIYSVRDAELKVFCPDGYRAPLEGRPFVPMIYDCVTLVWDYYAGRGLELPFLPRRGGFPRIDWTPWIAELGARIISGAPLPGDLLIMAVGGSSRPNHLGVYLGDSHFLHQRGDQRSGREVWVGDWCRNTQFIIRFPALTPLP